MSSTININLFWKDKFKLQLFLILTEFSHSQESLFHRLPKALVCSCDVKHKYEGEASNRTPKGCHYRPIFHEKSNGIETLKTTVTGPERKKLPSQIFREMNMENAALRNIWQGYREKCCLVIIPRLWPLSGILPGRAWAHLTSPPQCNTGAGSFNG